MESEMAAFYVEDATGEKYLFTVADKDYEPRFREHARWWIRYMHKPRQRYDGKWLYGPVKPTRIVIEE